MAIENATVENCLIEENQTRNPVGGLGRGGGVSAGLTSGLSDPSWLVGCVIRNNRNVEFGGGIFASGGETHVVRCSITGNVVQESGGGIHTLATMFLEDCTISGNESLNRGGGAIVASQNGTVNATNCVIHNNSAGNVGQSVVLFGFPSVARAEGNFSNCTIVQGNEESSDLIFNEGGRSGESQSSQIVSSGALHNLL